MHSPPSETGQRTEPSLPPLQGRGMVWVVDDSSPQREFCRAALAPTYDVRAFAGGAEMLEALGPDSAPDILVVDLYMGDMSGLDVCRFVRNMADFTLCPIVILTATGSRDDVLEALSAGANDFIRSPVSELELNARVAGLLRTARLHSSLSATERQLRIEAAFRERFMGMLAHDLRQPLQTVIMANDLLKHLHPADAATPIIERQRRAAGRLQRMVTELLDFTRHRPEHGLPVQRRRMDLAEVARQSVAEIRTAYPNRSFSLDIEGTCQGEWDPDRLAQILSNLLGNAIEHGAPNCRVEVCLTDEGDAVALRVSNQGPPIPDNLLESLRGPFRSDQELNPSPRGLRFGLHIVQQIVSAHGGSIAARSENGISHFSIELPKGLSSDDEAAQTSD